MTVSIGLGPNFFTCSGLGWVGSQKLTHGQLCVGKQLKGYGRLVRVAVRRRPAGAGKADSARRRPSASGSF